MKIRTIVLRGFRSFGQEEQRLDLSEKINFIWAGNSQGKTSFAEAMEFLLLGKTSRRDILSSGKDEFANSLRNAFLPSSSDVYVEMEICNNNQTHIIRRILVNDYGMKSDCISELYIDGKKSQQNDLHELGFVFSMPPLSTPILMQHCLSYLLTVGPQDRSEYFKFVFEIQDVDVFRDTVDKAINNTMLSDPPFISTVKNLVKIEIFKNQFNKFIKEPNVASELERAVLASASKIITFEDDNLEFVLDMVAKELRSKQTQMFPIDLFQRQEARNIDLQKYGLVDNIEKANSLQKFVSDSMRNFGTLYYEIDKLHHVHILPLEDDKCPVCSTPHSLSTNLLLDIKKLVGSNKEYQDIIVKLEADLVHIKNDISHLKQLKLTPNFITATSKGRREKGFVIDNIKKFVEDNEIIRGWLLSLISYLRSIRRYKRALNVLDETLRSFDIQRFAQADFDRLVYVQEEFIKNQNKVLDIQDKYATATNIIANLIKAKIAAQTNTEGWEDLLQVGKNIDLVSQDINKYHRLQKIRGTFAVSLNAIDKARASLLEEKFSDLSSEIKNWWTLLRPEESSYFESLQPRKNAKRAIDFKVGLKSSEQNGQIVLRDAISVFSQSQLNCLGLACFLAKMVDNKNKFLVLDDPILSVDEEHRMHFIHDVVPELINEDVQLILLTQDQKTWSALQNLHSASFPSVFILEMDNCADGTKVINKGDSAKAQLSSIKPIIRNKNIEIRKIVAGRMRSAAERLCKEILVKNESRTGKLVSIDTYSGKTLEDLIKLIQPYLSDPSHPGKFKNIKDILNPGNHDDEIPNTGELTVAYGDLVKFENVYCTGV